MTIVVRIELDDLYPEKKQDVEVVHMPQQKVMCECGCGEYHQYHLCVHLPTGDPNHPVEHVFAGHYARYFDGKNNEG